MDELAGTIWATLSGLSDKLSCRGSSASGWFDIEGSQMGYRKPEVSKMTGWACSHGENDYPLLFMIGVQPESDKAGRTLRIIQTSEGLYSIISLIVAA